MFDAAYNVAHSWQLFMRLPRSLISKTKKEQNDCIRSMFVRSCLRIQYLMSYSNFTRSKDNYRAKEKDILLGFGHQRVDYSAKNPINIYKNDKQRVQIYNN